VDQQSKNYKKILYKHIKDRYKAKENGVVMNEEEEEKEALVRGSMIRRVWKRMRKRMRRKIRRRRRVRRRTKRRKGRTNPDVLRRGELKSGGHQRQEEEEGEGHPLGGGGGGAGGGGGDGGGEGGRWLPR